ncbi:bifunctional RNase H/acid phosphatase [Actinotalea sp. Marseille-Q4924]|uniref:bifunctional RNase H/acid phosphatase n=1 Tax=Actinotalea sp. Marseille-Q4924 TaxID=2866571 RepID=UPI001CE44757|nr:bifunctional RNase H/acid phosphatase [Actinotalea sp. Marseille-Q4924]
MTVRRLLVEADGGSRGNPGPAGYGALVRDPVTGALLAERAGPLGVTTNNVAEYTALVAGLEAAREVDPDARVEVRMDSRLVVEQMSGRWQIKHADMQRLAARAREVLPAAQVTYTWVPRAQNGAADALANEAMDLREEVRRDHPDEGAAGARQADVPEDGRPGTEDLGTGAAAHVTGRGPAPRPSGAAMRFDDVEPLTVVLVRHGETELTLTRALSGSSVPGPALARSGRIQAARAADLVHRVGRAVWPDLRYPSRVLASPMVRTEETAGAIGRRIGQHVHTDPAFAEVDFGDWEGLSTDEVDERWPGELRRWYENPSVAAPGGESLTAVGVRVEAGLEVLLREGTGRTVVVVSHAMAIRAAVGVSLGLPARAWPWLRVVAASVSVVRWWPDGMREAVVIGLPTDL